MENKGTFTKILTAVGTVLVWLPILAPFIFGGIVSLRSGRFHFDYLMPGELFILVFAGGLLLLWGAVRAKCCRRIIGFSLLAAAILLVGSQWIAVASGLASGELEASGFWWILVLTVFGLYILAVIFTGIGGLRLLRKLYKTS